MENHLPRQPLLFVKFDLSIVEIGGFFYDGKVEACPISGVQGHGVGRLGRRILMRRWGLFAHDDRDRFGGIELVLADSYPYRRQALAVPRGREQHSFNGGREHISVRIDDGFLRRCVKDDRQSERLEFIPMQRDTLRNNVLD